MTIDSNDGFRHYIHDVVIKWKDFPSYWPFVRGIHRLPVNSPHNGRKRGALMFYLTYAWTKRWINNRYTSDSRRHRCHYYVTVMSAFVFRITNWLCRVLYIIIITCRQFQEFTLKWDISPWHPWMGLLSLHIFMYSSRCNSFEGRVNLKTDAHLRTGRKKYPVQASHLLAKTSLSLIRFITCTNT